MSPIIVPRQYFELYSIQLWSQAVGSISTHTRHHYLSLVSTVDINYNQLYLLCWSTDQPLKSSNHLNSFVNLFFEEMARSTRSFCLFVCLGSTTAFFPRGLLPKEDLRRSPSTTQATRHPRALSQSLFPLPPPPVLLSWVHPASGPYPPLSSCPIHIPYRVSGLFLTCFSVLHIYSNPTEKNPSTNIKPHIQTVLIHYFNKQTIKRAVYHYLFSPPVSSVPTCSSAPHLHHALLSHPHFLWWM